MGEPVGGDAVESQAAAVGDGGAAVLNNGGGVEISVVLEVCIHSLKGGLVIHIAAE